MSAISRHADAVLASWGVSGRARPLATGHINDTYIVEAGSARYVLQKVNRFVFRDPAVLARNFRKVEPWVREMVVPMMTTLEGEDWAVDAGGGTWRLYPYVEHRSMQRLPGRLIEPAAAGLGQFLSRLADADVTLETAIEGFHDVVGYLAELDRVRRAGVADAELAIVDERRRRLWRFDGPRQVIHGDCKVNNILFHPERDTVLRIIDLDTVMMGMPAWDFGDLVRSVAAGSEEADDAAPMSLERIELVARGFFGTMPNADHAAFAAAPAHMSFMLGVRFLADHFAGNRYFKVSSADQNLIRARSQFGLAAAFDRVEHVIAEAIVRAQRGV